MRYILLILLFLISAPTNAREIIRLEIRLVLVDDYADIPMNRFAFETPRYLGSAKPMPNGVCEIHVKDPKDVNDKLHMEILGHELVHCYKGNYHD